MKKVIEILRGMVSRNTYSEMTEIQQGYVTGLADALQVVEEEQKNRLVIGNIYYAIMFKNGDRRYPYIQKMRLYRINEKKKPAWCFTLFYKTTPTPDLVLYSRGGLTTRVFSDLEDAKRNLRYYESM